MKPVQALKMLYPLSFLNLHPPRARESDVVAQSVHSKYSDVRYPRPVSHPDTEMHVPPFDPICKAVHELSSNTAARSLSPDVQVARLAVALLVQCFAIGHEEEGRATSNDGQKDAGPATKE